MRNAPSIDVIKAFGEEAEPVLLSGGEGFSYKVGNIVLKPVQDVEQASWNADVLSSIDEDGFRVLRSIRSMGGEWVYKGWQAFQYLEGDEKKGNWTEKIAVSRRFHEKLRGISKPDFIGKRDIPWERADLAVWSEQPIEFHPAVQHITDSLSAHIQPIEAKEQLIHGDMTGNILFHPTFPPAIIDFSPYWRSAEYATAIIIVDSIVWEGAPDNLLQEMDNTTENNQLLMRAALWRMKTSELFSKSHDQSFVTEISNYLHFIKMLVQRVEKQQA
ncbi:MAG: TIGR02569 family protein [Patescibacteria group bacterium]